MPCTRVLPAQVEGVFNVEIETSYDMPRGLPLAFTAVTDSMEMFPQASVIALSFSGSEDTVVAIDMTPREALEAAKKLMAMCAAYTEDIGACDSCGELFPNEELRSRERFARDASAECTRCMELGR